jgi:molecular chaperone GrpE
MLKYKKNTKSEEIKNLENELKTNNNSAEDKISGLNEKENPEASNEAPDEALKGQELSDKKKLEDELAKKIKEIETLTDTMKRRQADFENYKKRMIKTQDEQRKFAIKDFALDIISINDDLLRAFDASCSISREKTVDEVCNTFSKGFSMISKSVEETLKKYGIEEIDSLNKTFDPNCNEAIETEESEKVDCDTITKVHQKGFRLGEYVLRSSRVKVSRPKKSSGNNDIKTETNNPENETANTTGENINYKV